MDSNNLPINMFDAKDIQTLKEVISQKWIVFEWQLIKAIEGTVLSDGTLLDPTGIIKRYATIVETAMKVNLKTWDMIEDTEMRMKALDKLTAIMLWKSGWSKWVTINFQNNNNLFDMKIPEAWKHLVY